MNLKAITTYQALVYQSRANRSVKAVIQEILRQHNLTMMQWSILGFIKDANLHGIRISDLAKKVDSSLAFITNSVNTLEKKGMVYRIGHERDNRSKLVFVTQEYSSQLGHIETELRKRLGQWLQPRIDIKDLEAHVRVLKALAQLAP